LNVSFALLVAMGTRRWLVRGMACLAMLAVLALVWHRVQPPWWDDTGDVAEMLDHQQDGSGYDGIDEYVPNGVDVYEIKKDARHVTFEGNGTSRIRITLWAAESKSLSANLSQPGRLVLKLFNYPAWKAKVNGRAVQTGMLKVTGQMVIPVEAGDNQVQIILARTRDREIGGLISFGTVILILVLMPHKSHIAHLSPS
jgi:hypothetical protein